MTRLVLLLAVLGAASPVAADPIRIRAGSLIMEAGAGYLGLEGDRGFTLTAGVSTAGGVLGPAHTCTGCAPGAAVSLASIWTGNDLAGTVTLDGQTFRIGGLDVFDANASVTFAGLAGTAPTHDEPNATLSAPFTFAGTLWYWLSPADAQRETFIGCGLATVHLSRLFPGSSAWQARRVEFTFTDDPLMAPEPGTLVLLTTGLGLGWLRRRSTAHQLQKNSVSPTGCF